MAFIRGTRGSDRLNGTDRGDVIDGLQGDDVLDGRGGNDVVIGGEGSDEVRGGEGDDFLIDSHLGAFNPAVLALYVAALGALMRNPGLAGPVLDQLARLPLPQVLPPDPFHDTLIGGAGDDILISAGGNDVMDGGGGNDGFLVAGASTKTIFSGDGDDVAIIIGSDNPLERTSVAFDGGLRGNDTVLMRGLFSEAAFSSPLSAGLWTLTVAITEGGESAQSQATVTVVPETPISVAVETTPDGPPQIMIAAGDGNDFVQISGVASANVHLGAGDDFVGFFANFDLFFRDSEFSCESGDGDDSFEIAVEAGARPLQLMIDAGDDNDFVQISGVAFGTVFLGAGNDVLHAEFGESSPPPPDPGDFPALFGFAGDDIIEFIGGRNLTLARQIVTDVGDGNDTVNAGRFEIETASFGLAITGGSGDDTLIGSNGKDNLHGGLGADMMTGGNSADIFEYDTPAEGGDVITDFMPGTDMFHISASGFDPGLVPGALPNDRFVSGADPVPVGVGVFLYDTGSGALTWDEDGAGGNPAVGIAILTNLAALTASDFFIV